MWGHDALGLGAPEAAHDAKQAAESLVEEAKLAIKPERQPQAARLTTG